MDCAEACEVEEDCHFFTVGADSDPWCILCRIAPTDSSAPYAT